MATDDDGSDLPTTPGPNAGSMNDRTRAIRAPLSLTEEERDYARFRLVELEWTHLAIAEAMGRPVEDIKLALANIRTRRKKRSRETLNISPAAAARFRAAQQTGEAMWETVNRVLGIS